MDYFRSMGLDLDQKANPADAFMHLIEEQNAHLDSIKDKTREKIDNQTNPEENERKNPKFDKIKPVTHFYIETLNPQIDKYLDDIVKSKKYAI
jgi:hypothetical protein